MPAEEELQSEDNNENDLERKLQSFLRWCVENALKLSTKVTVKFEGTSHRYGMIATDAIKKGETLFVVPRKLLIHSDNSGIIDEIIAYEEQLEGIGKSLEETSGWIPLLLTLMHEYVNKDSFWAPYLRLIPSKEEFGHPLFWSKEELEKNLIGLSLLYDVQHDILNIESEYNEYVLPFLHNNRKFFESIEECSLDLYKRMVAFVMAYSFTESETSPAMIPMADILNHHSDNNAHLVFDSDCLRMVSLKKIQKGEEIYNTFGKLGNAELLQMYGYVEKPTNQYDSVALSVSYFYEVLESCERLSPAYLQAMTAFLNKSGIAPHDDFYLFDKKGFRNGPDLMQMLKVLHMSESEFDEVLKARASKRANSFYVQLLRQLNLAKKTDFSSGVAVIDITEEETETDDQPEKRKLVDLQEIEDNDEDTSKRVCLDDGIQGTHGEAMMNARLKESLMMHHHQQHNEHSVNNGLNNTVGNCKLSAIVVDDDDDDENSAEVNTEASEEDNICKDSDSNAAISNETGVEKNEEKHASEIDDLNIENTNEKDAESKNKRNHVVCPDGDTNDTENDVCDNTVTVNGIAIDENCTDSLNDDKLSSEKIVAKQTNSAQHNETSDSDKKKLPNESSLDSGMSSCSDDKLANAGNSLQKNSSSDTNVDETESSSVNEKNVENIGEFSAVSESCKPMSNDSVNPDKETESTDANKDKDSIENEPDQGMGSYAESENEKDADCSNKNEDRTAGDDLTNEEGNIEENEGEMDSDNAESDIEFVSEDIVCTISYENLNSALSAVQKETMRSVLQKQLETLTLDRDTDDVVAMEAKSRNELNAFEVRKGQRAIVKLFLSSLT